MAVALLEGNYRPPHARQDFPKADSLLVDRHAGFALIAAVERGEVGNPTALPVGPRKAPTLAAKPADILVRIAPAGEFPIEDHGQHGTVQQVIAGAEIVMAEHRPGRRRDVRLEPAHTPFDHRPRCGMTVEIVTKPGDL